jgi:hypothetical protein
VTRAERRAQSLRKMRAAQRYAGLPWTQRTFIPPEGRRQDDPRLNEEKHSY